MKIDAVELNQRLEEAVRIRAILRRASLEWAEVGRIALQERSHNGSERSHDGHSTGGSSDPGEMDVKDTR